MKAQLLVWSAVAFMTLGAACFAGVLLFLAGVWWRDRVQELRRVRANLSRAERAHVWIERGVRR